MTGEVLSGPERRRRWGSEEKARLVAEIMVPGAKVTAIARRRGISRSLLYTWRREAGQAAAIVSAPLSPLPDRFVPVMITDGAEGRTAASVAGRAGGGCNEGHRHRDRDRALPGSVRVTVSGRIEESGRYGRFLRRVEVRCDRDTGRARVLIATRPVDFRKGMDGLAAVVKEHLRADPYSRARSSYSPVPSALTG